MTEWKNKLYLGDNLFILRDHVPDESVDLVYLDPPFNSNANYNVLFKEKSGEQSAAQITAFEDTWHWGVESEMAYTELIRTGRNEKLKALVEAFRLFLGQNDMMAYLTMMAQRLAELHRVLKPTGSIYLHCDPTASHYLKLLMDAVFGTGNYQNEIIWKRSSAHSDSGQGAKHMGRLHDTILFYSKSEQFTCNPQYLPYDKEYVDKFYRHIEPETGRRYTLGDTSGPGGAAKGCPYYEFLGVTRYWRFSKSNMEELYKQGRIVQSKPGAVPRYKRYLDEMPGVPFQDLWEDLTPIGAQARERLGYPTQKPEALLERIINYSSNEGDVVLDPFCGCGTAVAVAEKLHRRWIGIDITHLAITLMRHRLANAFGADLSPYEIIGVPTDLESARALARESDFQGRYQFEWWALGLVDAHPAQDKKKGADRGIDGYIHFFDDNSGKSKSIVVQVKSGHVNAAQIRDLKGTVDRDQAAIGVFITLEEPTRPMRDEAVSANFYTPESFPDSHYPKIQILTIRELLDGAQVQYPRVAPAVTFKRARRTRKAGGPEQGRMM